MAEIAQAFSEGGIWMYLILVLALVVIPTSLATVLIAVLAKAGRKLLLVLAGFKLLITVLVVAVGAVAWWVGMVEVRHALEYAPPDVQAEMLAMGERIAGYPLWFAIFVAIPPGLVAVGLGVAAALRGAPAPEPPTE